MKYLKLTTLAALALSAVSFHAQAMEKDTIYSMPADADHSQYYLAGDLQPEKGVVKNAEQCLKACQAADGCVVWTFKPGRFGSPNSCKLSPKLMHEKGITTPFAGAASGIVE